ncbi:hypothetical protein SDC9_202893 [bioreactor metagenome]|uniref:Uncharacterized protein n=1 Tax=bioreactor metagenome TaxID=1076179 RepID=A0A645J3Y7_9ZZZZ
MLKTTDRDSAEAVAEGVVAMRALYSVNASIDEKGAASSGTWQAPSGDFAIDKLVAENPPTRIRSIIAVRVALLLRSNVRQNEQVAKESYTLLDGLPAEATINLSSTDRRFSHRVVEATIPLRPMMMRLLPPEEMK